MTLPSDPPVAPSPPVAPPSSSAPPEGVEEKARHVAATAESEARHVLDDAVERVDDLRGEAWSQASHVLDTATGELESQIQDRVHHAVDLARTRADELDALCDGRPEDAGRSLDLVRDASRRLRGAADRVDDLGVRGVVDEVGDFARRRPVLFLAGAAAAGVLVGRMARAGAEERGRTQASPETRAPQVPAAAPPPPPDLVEPPGLSGPAALSEPTAPPWTGAAASGTIR